MIYKFKYKSGYTTDYIIATGVERAVAVWSENIKPEAQQQLIGISKVGGSEDLLIDFDCIEEIREAL